MYQPIFSILWKNSKHSGLEFCSLFTSDQGWLISGVILEKGKNNPLKINYEINCDLNWKFLSSKLDIIIGLEKEIIDIKRSKTGDWYLNSKLEPEYQSISYLDFEFSPVTQILPINNLNLDKNESEIIDVAYLSHFQFNLSIRKQEYIKTSHKTYYFKDNLKNKEHKIIEINHKGFVLKIPKEWEDISFT